MIWTSVHQPNSNSIMADQKERKDQQGMIQFVFRLYFSEGTLIPIIPIKWIDKGYGFAYSEIDSQTPREAALRFAVALVQIVEEPILFSDMITTFNRSSSYFLPKRSIDFHLRNVAEWFKCCLSCDELWTREVFKLEENVILSHIAANLDLAKGLSPLIASIDKEQLQLHMKRLPLISCQ